LVIFGYLHFGLRQILANGVHFEMLLIGYLSDTRFLSKPLTIIEYEQTHYTSYIEEPMTPIMCRANSANKDSRKFCPVLL